MPGSGSGRVAVGSRLTTLARIVSGKRSMTSLGAALSAALSLGLAAGGAPGWTAVVAWIVAAAGLTVEAGGIPRRQRGADATAPPAGLGREVATRVLLIVAAGFGAERNNPSEHAGIWLGIVIVVVTVLAEPMVARAQPRAEVAGLPGFRDAPGVGLVGWMAPATTVVLALAGLVGVVTTAWPARVALPVVALMVFALEVAVGLLNARDRGPRRVRLRHALEAHAPRFAVYTARDDGGPYQVAMWLPYLEQLNVPYVIVTRRARAVRALAEVSAAPVIARDSWRDLDDVMVPTMGAAFYVNSVAANSNFVSYRQLTHVYLGHGESDKSLSHHPQHAMFDRVFVAGPAAIERYARNGVAMRPEAFVIVGRPQLSALRSAPAAGVGDRAGLTTVLYAPTWAGYNDASAHSSLARGVAIVRALSARGAVVIFRPHPFSRHRPGEREQAAAIDAALREDLARSGRPHRWGPSVDRESFIETANDSDVMVADVSSVVVDYLATDKPLAVVMIGAPDAERFIERNPVAQSAYLLGPEPQSWSEPLDGLLGGDPLRARREATRDFYLGGLDGPAAVAAFIAAARDAIGDAHQRRSRAPS